MDLTLFQKRLTLGALAAGLFYILTDASVIALIPAPWGMIVSNFLIGTGIGGVFYNMDPKKEIAALPFQEPKK